MIDQAVAVEHIRAHLAEVSGKDVFVARPSNDRPATPYALIFVLPIARRPYRPLVREPGPWQVELQITSVGRNLVDATWMGTKVDEGLRTCEAPEGYADIGVEGTVGPIIGPSEGVVTIVQRWMVTV